MKPEIGTMWKFFSLCSHVLIMTVHVQISVALFLNECPEKLMWTLRAKQLCEVEDKYMCLYDTNERSFRELCKESPEFHRPGNVFVISGNLQYFAGRPCYANRYQPHKWWTNGSSDCQYLKSSCNGEGQVPYDNGTIASDRKCRCDYTNYYTFVNTTRNKCHCDPIEEDCSCYRKRCNEDQVLTPDYDCVGVHQWTGRYVCPEYKQPKINDDNKMQQITICPDIEKDLSGTVHQLHARIAVTLTSGVLMILGLMTTIAFLINRNTRQDMDKVWRVVQKMEKNFEENQGNSDLKETISPMNIRDITMNHDEVIPKHIHEQFERRLEQWKVDDQLFVSTEAEKHVMQKVLTQSSVTLVGNSGIGKSFLSKHIALLMKKQGYTVIPCSKPEDICKWFKHGRQTLFVYDDVCGRYSLNQQMYTDWKQHLDHITSLLTDQYCKILSTCKLEVYKNEHFRNLSIFKMCNIDLSSHEFKLSAAEQNALADVYFRDNTDEVKELSEKYDFFPFLCSLYYRQNLQKNASISSFFSNPFDFLKDQLIQMYGESDAGKMQYCSLVICVMFNNTLTEENWSIKDETVEQVLNDILAECELSEGTPIKRLKKSLETLEGTYVVKEDSTYRIIYDKMFDFLAKYFGERMLQLFFDHANTDFIAERFIWKTTDSMGTEIESVIKIPDNYIDSYINRLMRDWTNGYVYSVCHNRNMKSTLFTENFVTHLNQFDQSKQQELVCTKDIHSKDIALSGSCDIGTVDLVKWLISRNSDINYCREDGWFPLLLASQEGHVDVVKELLQHSADVNKCDNNGVSPLYSACQNGHVDVVKKLIQHSADVNKCSNDGTPPLQIACYNKRIEVVRVLLQCDDVDIDHCDDDGCSSLYKASQEGHVDVVKELLQHLADVNKCNNNDASPLYIASQKGHVDVVKELLQHSADVNKCNDKGQNPLHVAHENVHLEIESLLLKKGANQH